MTTAKMAEPKTPKTWKGWKEGIIQNSEVPSAVTKDNQEVWPSIHDAKVEGKRPNSIITIIMIFESGAYRGQKKIHLFSKIF